MNSKKLVLSNKWLLRELIQTQAIGILGILGFSCILNANLTGELELLNKVKRLPNLHINRPDFMLMSKESWHSVRGFPEIDTLGFVDGILCYAAYLSGIKEEILPASHCIYHIDHDSTFAVTTKPTIKERIIFSFLEGETAIKLNEILSIIISKSPLSVFKKKSKLLSKGISYLNWRDIWRIICEMKDGKCPTILNDNEWGLGCEKLPDYNIRKANWER